MPAWPEQRDGEAFAAKRKCADHALQLVDEHIESLGTAGDHDVIARWRAIARRVTELLETATRGT